MESESIAVSESNVADSFIPSSTGDDVQNHEVLDNNADQSQLQVSPLEIRQQEADAIRDLERDMTDLLDIHKDLNEHIHAQGEGVDRIELQTEKSANRVAKGHTNTKTAVEINRENKTLIWIIVGISAVVILVILVTIIVLVAVLASR